MSYRNREPQSREIISKAVCGKGRKFSQATHTVTPPHRPSSILGAWIINHQYEAVPAENGVEVVGTYDINLWYSYDKNTKTDVAKETVSYVDYVTLSYLDPKHRSSTVEVTAEATQEPTCIEANVTGNGQSVELRVEREFQVEMIAETKLRVLVVESDEDDGKEFFDEQDDYPDDYEDLDLSEET